MKADILYIRNCIQLSMLKMKLKFINEFKGVKAHIIFSNLGEREENIVATTPVCPPSLTTEIMHFLIGHHCQSKARLNLTIGFPRSPGTTLTASMMTEYGVLPVKMKPNFLAPFTKAASSVKRELVKC